MDAGSFADIEKLLLAPIGSQEVWASGVTYYRSRNARMEEAKTAGGGDFYDRVYAGGTSRAFYESHAQSRGRPSRKSRHKKRCHLVRARARTDPPGQSQREKSWATPSATT